MFRKCLYSGFRGIVGGVSWRIGNSLLGACNYDGAGVRGGGVSGYEGKEGGEPMYYTKKVDIHYFVEIGRVWPRAAETYSCIESKELDFA